MAGRYGQAVVTSNALGAGVVETVIQLVAAANHGIKVTEVAIGFTDVDATHVPVLVEILRQSDAGTSSALTLVKSDDSIADTLDTTALKSFTAEPAAGDILKAFAVHPQSSLIYPIPPDAPIIVGAGDRLGIRCTATSATNCHCTIGFEE